MDRGERAECYFRQGYNCSQAMVLAFSDLLNLDEAALSRMACGFGGGISRLREVCGTMSGTVMILDLLFGYEGPETGEKKRALYARVQDMAGRLEKANGSIVCRELLGLRQQRDTPEAEARTAGYYQKRPCAGLIAAAARILQAYLQENGIEGA